jgi:hypothetical protein
MVPGLLSEVNSSPSPFRRETIHASESGKYSVFFTVPVLRTTRTCVARWRGLGKLDQFSDGQGRLAEFELLGIFCQAGDFHGVLAGSNKNDITIGKLNQWNAAPQAGSRRG